MDGKAFKDLAVAARLSWQSISSKKQIRGTVGQEISEFLESDKRAVGSIKKLFDPKTEEIKKLESIKNETNKYWRDNTYEYMERGVRLTRKDNWMSVKEQMEAYRKQIKDAEKVLQENRDQILEKSKSFLGEKLFSLSDYPVTFEGSFDFELEPVNIEPPSYLMQLDPEAYDKAQKVLEQKLDSSLALFEEQIFTGLSGMLNHLVEKMKPGEDGKKKVFHESTFQNLWDLMKQYKELKVRDNEALDKLVDDAEKKLKGFDVGGIRASEAVRNQVVKEFEGLAKEAEKYVTQLPGRKVKLKEKVSE